MRAKRSKQYRKLIERFERQFGFREPYQVLVDSLLVQDASRFKMELQPALERTLHGKVKVMISQCSMRHLYARGKEHGGAAAVQEAKAFERRRCGHRPEDYPEPLPELECLVQCVTGKAARKADEEEAEGGKRPGKGRKGRGSEDKNKHCYVVASQDEEVRRRMREVPGVPLIYIARSVMIMEPVSDVSTAVLAKTERGKFTNEITKLTGKKRKRGADADAGSGGNDDDDDDDADEDGGAEKSDEQARAKAKRNYGRKGPNPLSIKKKKKKPAQEGGASAAKEARDPEAAPKKKRIRKSKTKTLEKEASVGEGESAAVEAATTS